MARTYDIKVFRDDKWLMVEIPEIDGLTQARHPGEVVEMATEYIAMRTGVDESEVNVRRIGDDPA